MKEFGAAAKRAEADDEEVLEFRLLDHEFVASKPTTGQLALIYGTMGEDSNPADVVKSTFDFLKGVLKDDGYKVLHGMLQRGEIDLDILIGGDEENELGIIDWMMEQVAERPTKAPSDYLQSQKSGGQRSTGRAPGKGSIQSGSPRAGS